MDELNEYLISDIMDIKMESHRQIWQMFVCLKASNIKSVGQIITGFAGKLAIMGQTALAVLRATDRFIIAENSQTYFTN